MKGPPILFRADASHAIGFGHLARIAALVDECHARGRPALVHAGGDLPMVNAWLHDHELVNRCRSRRVTALVSSVVETGASTVVLDGPALVNDLAPALIERGVKLLVVDDDARLPFAVDTVVNHNLHAPELADSYRARSLLLGRTYALLRRDIRRLTRGSCRPRRGERLRLIISFGGSDPIGATARTVRLLPKTRPLDVVVLAGPAYRDNGALHTAAAAAEAGGHTVDVHRAPADPGALFVTADAAISSGGGTLGELAFLGCPALAFAIVADQKPGAAAQASRGLVAGGDDISALGDDAIRSQIAAFIDNDRWRDELRANALATIDGNGASRVIATL